MPRARIADDEVRVRCYIRTNGDGSGSRASIYITGGRTIASMFEGGRIRIEAGGPRQIVLRRSEEGIAMQRDRSSGRMFMLTSAVELLKTGLLLDGLDGMVRCSWSEADDGVVVHLPALARDASMDASTVRETAHASEHRFDAMERIAVALERIATMLESGRPA
jgi:uncharacterized protein YodC (DUF2158 family)